MSKESPSTRVPVLIAGAGPVGLALAIELAGNVRGVKSVQSTGLVL